MYRKRKNVYLISWGMSLFLFLLFVSQIKTFVFQMAIKKLKTETENSLSTTLPFRFLVHPLHWSGHSLSPPCPFRPSSILQTSVGPRLLIPPAFHTPPALNYPPTPLYLTHKTPPTLTHWWFSTWGAQPHHPTDGSLPLTHQPINLHLPTP